MDTRRQGGEKESNKNAPESGHKPYKEDTIDSRDELRA